MHRRNALQLLKIIGILLFLWILARIDLSALMETAAQARVELLLAAIALVFATYFLKALRWHTMIRAMGSQQSFAQSWRIYLLGLFFGLITPGKLGEFGKVAYLRRDGISTKLGCALVILDRIADVITISVLGIAAVGLLFGWQWSCILGIAACTIAGILSLVARKSSFVQKLFHHKKIQCLLPHVGSIVGLTLLNWTVYFLWAFSIARSIHIEMPLLPLAACFVLTAICSMLPIAPSGLGTRDVALLTLLAPFGVQPEEAVALAMLMFASIVLSCPLGGYYWLTAKHRSNPKIQHENLLEKNAPFNS